MFARVCLCVWNYMCVCVVTFPEHIHMYVCIKLLLHFSACAAYHLYSIDTSGV